MHVALGQEAMRKKVDAQKFIKENGGAPAMFDEAMKLAREDMYRDPKMIREQGRR